MREVFAIKKDIVFGNTTDTEIGFLPPNAYITNITIDVITAFDDTGTDLLNVGKTGTTNAFVSALDVAATGRKAPTILLGGVVQSATEPTKVTAKYTGQNANAAAGKASVCVMYAFDRG
jgi:hypothetical protein